MVRPAFPNGIFHLCLISKIRDTAACLPMAKPLQRLLARLPHRPTSPLHRPQALALLPEPLAQRTRWLHTRLTGRRMDTTSTLLSSRNGCSSSTRRTTRVVLPQERLELVRPEPPAGHPHHQALLPLPLPALLLHSRLAPAAFRFCLILCSAHLPPLRHRLAMLVVRRMSYAT